MLVYDYNQIPGNSFQVFYSEQRFDFVVPQTTTDLIASKDAGLTNQQNWIKNQVAIAGAVAPCANTKTEVNGFVCALSTSWVPSGPKPPTNVRVVP